MIGGAGPENPLAGAKNAGRSIVNLYPDKLSLTVGGKAVSQRDPTKKYSDQLYKDHIPSSLGWKSGLLLFLGGATAVTGAVAKYRGNATPQDTGNSPDWDDWKGIGVGAAAAVIGGTFALWSVIKAFAKKGDIEPVEHDTPDAEITMDKDSVVLQKGKDAEIKMVKDGVSIKTGKNEVHIKKDGSITIVGDKDINIVAGGDIGFKTKSQPSLVLDKQKFAIRGPIEHASLKVT